MGDFHKEDYKDNKTFDVVASPKHYTDSSIECIDAMEAAYGTEAVMWFCVCNAFKYQWRFKKKNGVEDLKKSQWYTNKYIELSKKVEALAYTE
jgi:hypothetical protein